MYYEDSDFAVVDRVVEVAKEVGVVPGAGRAGLDACKNRGSRRRSSARRKRASRRRVQGVGDQAHARSRSRLEEPYRNPVLGFMNRSAGWRNLTRDRTPHPVLGFRSCPEHHVAAFSDKDRLAKSGLSCADIFRMTPAGPRHFASDNNAGMCPEVLAAYGGGQRPPSAGLRRRSVDPARGGTGRETCSRRTARCFSSSTARRRTVFRSGVCANRSTG